VWAKSAKWVDMSLNQSTVHVDWPDAWCKYCYEYVDKDQMETHLDKFCWPTLPWLDLIKSKGANVDEIPYLDEQIFKVSKAITKHLANELKTKEGLFNEIS